jgi:DNA adenine methylase
MTPQAGLASTAKTGPMKARPFVKWAGGKRGLLSEIRPHVPVPFVDASVPECPRYYEPFVGGGALFFELGYAPTVLGDVNAKLITAYRALRDDPEAVIANLHRHTNDERHYYEVRSRNFEVGSLAERAAEFLFALRVGFNGLYRENRAGRYNVPFGKNPNATICDADNLRAVSALLQGVRILHGDFAETVKDAVAGDFVYFDPPYAPLSATSSFTSYVGDGFSIRDQERLRDLARALKAQGVHVLVSNSSAVLIRDLYSVGFYIQEVQAARAINSKGGARGPVTELLIT